MIIKTPYKTQWESSSKVSDILSGNILARQDINWQKSGAISPEEYEFWSWNICGIACLSMILSAKNISHPGLVALAKDAAQHKVFDVSKSYIGPLKYKDFCKWVHKRFNLPSKPDTHLTQEKIISMLCDNHYVVASVNARIRNPQHLLSELKGGHLVLLIGYTKTSFILHNPSGLYRKSQKSTRITFEDFESFFANRGIIV